MGDDEERLFASVFRANPTSQSISSIAPSPRECSGHVPHILPTKGGSSQPIASEAVSSRRPTARPSDNRSHAASEGRGRGSDLAVTAPELNAGPGFPSRLRSLPLERCGKPTEPHPLGCSHCFAGGMRAQKWTWPVESPATRVFPS